MDDAAVDRQHRVRAQAVKAEPPPTRAGDSLELTANPVPPRIIHTEDAGIRRQAEARSRPGLFDHLPLQLELMGVRGMLQLAAAAGAEVRARRGDAMGRGFDHASGRRDSDTALAAARLRLDDLARQRVVDKPHLAVITSDRGPAVGRRRWPQDQRRHRETGSRAGLKPAASTICVATRKPAAILSGLCASLPYCTACPPSSRHHRTTVMSGHSLSPRVVFTSSTRPVRAAAFSTSRISGSKSFSLYGGAPSIQ